MLVKKERGLCEKAESENIYMKLIIVLGSFNLISIAKNQPDRVFCDRYCILVVRVV
jgi:hypothetical protein